MLSIRYGAKCAPSGLCLLRPSISRPRLGSLAHPGPVQAPNSLSASASEHAPDGHVKFSLEAILGKNLNRLAVILFEGMKKYWASILLGLAVTAVAVMTGLRGQETSTRASTHQQHSHHASVSLPRFQPVADSHIASPYAAIAMKQQARADAGKVLVYKLQKVFAMNMLAKVCAVVAFAAPIVLISGKAYQMAAGGSYQGAMFKTYTVLQDTPGADACAEDDFMAGLIINVTHVVGIFTYALVLGVVVEDVNSTVSDFKRGNTAICETGHTLILNQNRHAAPLIRQWGLALQEQGKEKSCIVVMADVDKDQLDVMVDEVRRQTGMDVMGRQGRPYSLDDLDMVSAKHAQTIIMMDPLQDNPWHKDGEFEKVPPHTATLVSLAAIGAGPMNGQVLVMQAPDSHTGDDMLASAMRLHDTSTSGCIPVADVKSLAELEAQCAVQPGLSQFYNSAFTQSKTSCEFYTRSFDMLEGKTYREARKMFRQSCVIGCWVDGNKLMINPADDYIIQKDDWMVGIAADMSKFEPRQESIIRTGLQGLLGKDESEAWQKPSHIRKYQCKRIMVLCFGNLSPEMVHGLEEFLPRRAKVTLVSQQNVQLPRGKFKARRVDGHPASTDALIEAGLEHADSVVIAGVDEWDDTEADIQVLSSITQLSDACRDMNRKYPLHIVATAKGPLLDSFAETLQCITERRTDDEEIELVTTDILHTDELIAGVLAQSALQPKIAPVLKDMFDSSGNRVVMQCIEECASPGESVTFAEIEDRVRSYGGTVVGYFKKDGDMVMSPDKYGTIKIDDVAHFIVITGDH